MRYSTVLLASVAVLGSSTPLAAQKYHDTDVDGNETCQSIWREFGRHMSGRPVAVYCEIRDIGSLPNPNVIAVDGGDRNGVKVVGMKRSDARVRLVIQTQGTSTANARELARDVQLDLTRSPLSVTGISVLDGKSSRRFVSAIIVIDAPEQADLLLRVNYAALEVDNVRGKMDLRASYGPLTIRDVGGDVRARVDHGPIGVYLSGDKWQGTGLDAVAEYGPVTLALPRNYGAELEIGALNGPFDSDFPLTLRRFDSARIQTILGQGGPRIRAVAEYGPMSLRVNR